MRDAQVTKDFVHDLLYAGGPRVTRQVSKNWPGGVAALEQLESPRVNYVYDQRACLEEDMTSEFRFIIVVALDSGLFQRMIQYFSGTNLLPLSEARSSYSYFIERLGSSMSGRGTFL